MVLLFCPSCFSVLFPLRSRVASITPKIPTMTVRITSCDVSWKALKIFDDNLVSGGGKDEFETGSQKSSIFRAGNKNLVLSVEHKDSEFGSRRQVSLEVERLGSGWVTFGARQVSGPRQLR